MSVKAHTYHTITCDGCGKAHGEPGQYQGAAAVRRGAMAAGWVLVPKRLPGDRSARLNIESDSALTNIGRSANDVCPNCAAQFKPEQYESGRSGQPPWWQQRIDRLHEENERLKAELLRQ